MGEPLHYQYDSKTILELVNLQEKGHLNLEPGFQRNSVWSSADRRRLIQSVLEGYPVPSIFFYRREENGLPVYDVVDGKQRLETIFMFMRAKGFKRDGFEARFQVDDDAKPVRYHWRELQRRRLSGRFLGYRFQATEVSGALSDIVDLFVRINSTGKALSASEKRHARFYTSAFLREAERLSRHFRRYFLDQHILREQQVRRMKDVELVSELLASIVGGGPINKKDAIDRAVGNEALNRHTLRKAVRELGSALRATRRIFPHLRTTRFHNSSEFYSLALVVWDWQRQRCVLSDRRRNRAAEAILTGFSDAVDRVREVVRKGRGTPRGQSLYVEYFSTVQAATDNLAQRTARANILRGLFAGLFERKDERRTFGQELRRLLWNSDEKKGCTQCGKPLDWTNFQVDHVKAHSRGGRTELANAALICQPCNASKGARKRARWRRRYRLSN
jgi:hypothetical protein